MYKEEEYFKSDLSPLKVYGLIDIHANDTKSE